MNSADFNFETDISIAIDFDQPGIYEWQIEGSGSYVGKSRRLRSRLREYPNNIRKIILGLPYRKGKPAAFRHVHHELHRAQIDGRRIKFTVIENCELTELNERERYWIIRRGTLKR